MKRGIPPKADGGTPPSLLRFSTANPDKTTRQKATLSLLPFLFLFAIPSLSLLPHASACLLSLLLLLLALGFFQNGKALAHLPSSLWLLGGFFLLGALSPLLLLEDASALLPLLCFLAALLPFLLPHSPTALLRLYGLLGGVLGVFTLLSLLTGGGAQGFIDASHSYAAFGRSAVFFGNPNLLAAFLLPSVPGNLFALSKEAGRGRLLFLLSLLFSLLGLALTLCRGAWLAAALGALLFLSLRQKSLFPFALALSLLPAFFIVMPAAFTERLLAILRGDSSVSYRLTLWHSLLSLPPSFYLLGVGEGKRAFIRFLLPHLAAGLERVEHTHSVFLHLLITEGIGGLLTLLYACAKALLSPLPLAEREAALALRCALLSLLLFGLSDDLLYATQTGVIFCWLLGVNLSLQSSLPSFFPSFFFFRRRPVKEKGRSR